MPLITAYSNFLPRGLHLQPAREVPFIPAAQWRDVFIKKGSSASCCRKHSLHRVCLQPVWDLGAISVVICMCCAVLRHSVMSDSLWPPWIVACQSPLSMGFSRQEYWSRLPYPSPGDLPNPRIEPRSPALQADSLLFELPGKAKNTGGGSLALLQGNFPTQESNQGLLHCRQIFY